jgi:hypothetical protein
MSRWLRFIVAAATPLALLAGAAHAQQQADSGAAPAASAAIDASASSDDQEDASALAKKLQNPIGNLISVPFQSNTNFSVGPNKGTQEILNIQPVIPFHIGDNWNIITRTILPLIWQPSYQPLASVAPFGTGPITFSSFLSPANPTNGWLWGFGPVTQIPVASSASLGSNVWGLGPTGVLVYMKGPWVTGVLVNNVWSLGGEGGPGGTKYNNFLMQPFVNFNMKGGWYVGTSPILTANWLTAGNNAWTIPLGMNVGRVIKLGKLPINLSGGAYANVVHPEFDSTWQLRTQITFIF